MQTDIILETDLPPRQVAEFAQLTEGYGGPWPEPFQTADEAALRLHEYAAAIRIPRKELMRRLRP